MLYQKGLFGNEYFYHTTVKIQGMIKTWTKKSFWDFLSIWLDTPVLQPHIFLAPSEHCPLAVESFR